MIINLNVLLFQCECDCLFCQNIVLVIMMSVVHTLVT